VPIETDEELLDEIVEMVLERLGRWRDAVSRNQMKLNDLSGRADYTPAINCCRSTEKLEDNLDYVYRRGEISCGRFTGFRRFFSHAGGAVLTRFLICRLGGLPVLGVS